MSYTTPPEGAPAYSTPNSSLAIISLVAGILGLTFFPLIGSIVAIITGYMAKKEIRASAGALSGDGLATAGLVLGWIVIGISLIGLCCGCAIFGVLIPLGIMGSHRSSLLLPAVLAFL
jgi:hypothetical protein